MAPAGNIRLVEGDIMARVSDVLSALVSSPFPLIPQQEKLRLRTDMSLVGLTPPVATAAPPRGLDNWARHKATQTNVIEGLANFNCSNTGRKLRRPCRFSRSKDLPTPPLL